jgi:formate hydrogenlyase subunit 4
MTQAETWVWQLVQGVIFVLIAPLVLGMLRWLRARMAARHAEGVNQYYRDLFKLLRKPTVKPRPASWFYDVAPAIVFVCCLLPGFLAPIFFPGTSREATGRPWVSGDLLMIIALFGLARMMTGLAGLDSGAPLAGLGSSRELFLHVLAEPALIFIVCSLTLSSHTSGLPGFLWSHSLVADGERAFAIGIASIASLLLSVWIIALLEGGRLPFDNPTSHLELTMSSEAINLEYAGPHLALLQWANALRLTFLLGLLANLMLILISDVSVMLFNMFLGWIAGIQRTPEAPKLNETATSFDALRAALYLLRPVVVIALLGFLTVVLSMWEAQTLKLRLLGALVPALLSLALAILSVMLVITRAYLS